MRFRLNESERTTVAQTVRRDELVDCPSPLSRSHPSIKGYANPRGQWGLAAPFEARGCLAAETLSPEQKQRMGELAISVLREMRNAVEQRRLDAEEMVTIEGGAHNPAPSAVF